MSLVFINFRLEANKIKHHYYKVLELCVFSEVYRVLSMILAQQKALLCFALNLVSIFPSFLSLHLLFCHEAEVTCRIVPCVSGLDCL